jgi:hypothetical protein
VTQITDGLANNWTKGYDALLRNTTITTPSVSGASYTLMKEYDGNGNITKVTDFKGNATPEAGHSCPAKLFPPDKSVEPTENREASSRSIPQRRERPAVKRVLGSVRLGYYTGTGSCSCAHFIPA